MKYFILFIFFTCLISCNNNNYEDLELIESSNSILKERPTDNKWTPFFFQKKSTKSASNQSLCLKDFIGYSFRHEISPIEDTRNIGCRIINVTSLSKDYPGYFHYWKNLSNDAKVFSFSSFEDYSLKSEISKNVTNGAELKLLCFSFGHKHTYESTFGQNLINNSKSIFSELNILHRDSCFRMQYSDIIKKIILKKYLDSSFIEELRTTHPYDFFNKYGGFVAIDYCSGGRATAIYTGLYNKESLTEEKENNLTNEVNASFSWDKNSTNGHLTIGRGNSSTISTTNSFSSVKVSIKTLGGSAVGGFSIPQEVAGSSVDLSNWLSSLSDKSLHVISEFNKDGLVPISDFILEKNLKELFNKFIEGGMPRKTSIIEPYILIGQVNPNINDYSLLEAELVTRYGEWIPLNIVFGKFHDLDFTTFWQWIDDIADIFQIKVINASSLPSKKRSQEHVDLTIGGAYYHNLIAHKLQYKKFVHNGILYIIDEEDKMGFSILNNQYLINEYGLKDFLSKIKQSSINYNDLIDENYLINAL